MRYVIPSVAAWCLLSGGCTQQLPTELVPGHRVGALEQYNNETIGVIDVKAQPSTVTPGSSLTITVESKELPNSTVHLELGSEKHNISLANGFGEMTLNAPNTPGNHGVIATATMDTLAAFGHAIVVVADHATTCPPQEIAEAGKCVAKTNGHRLVLDGSLRGFEPGRNMVHPRDAAWNDDSLVLCNTDSIALVPLNQPPCPYEKYAEVMHNVSGLAACEHLALDKERSLVLTTSRGDSGSAGGLAVWTLNGNSAPTHRKTIENEGGFEDVLIAKNIAYVAQKQPAKLRVFCLDDPTEPTDCGSTTIPGLAAPWSLAKHGDLLLLTDVGTAFHDHTSRQPHAHDEEGHLHILDVSKPKLPLHVATYIAAGPVRAVAMLPNDVAALAVGPEGIELVDISTPTSPEKLHIEATPAAVYSLAWTDGYLLAAQWNALRLYDASHHGFLVPLDAADMHARKPPPGVPFSGCQETQWQFRALSFVSARGSDVVACEFSRMVTGHIQPGRDAPRAVRHNYPRIVSTAAFEKPMPIGIRFDNGGRETLVLNPLSDEHVTPVTTSVVLGPGEMGIVEVVVNGKPDDGDSVDIFVTSNEPGTPHHKFEIRSAEGHLAAGDPAPVFKLPALNCANGNCQLSKHCFEPNRSDVVGRPIVLAFFGSW